MYPLRPITKDPNELYEDKGLYLKKDFMRSFMKAVFAVLFLLCSVLVSAQSQFEIRTDSVSHELERIVGVYVSPGYTVNRFVETGASFVEIRLGADLLDEVDVALSYSRILDNYKKQIIFPSNHKYDQTNFGIQGQYSFSKKNIRPHVGFGVRLGLVNWTSEYDSSDEFTDRIYFYEAIVGVDWLITGLLTLRANAGYTLAEGVDIVGLEPDDYDGLKAEIMLKVRLLKF